MKKVTPWIFVVIASLCLFSCKGYVNINGAHESKMGSHDVTIKPGGSTSSSSSMTSGSDSQYSLECGGTSITIDNEELTVNGAHYGKLKTNETILVENGIVSVAGAVRKPLPTPAAKIEPSEKVEPKPEL